METLEGEINHAQVITSLHRFSNTQSKSKRYIGAALCVFLLLALVGVAAFEGLYLLNLSSLYELVHDQVMFEFDSSNLFDLIEFTPPNSVLRDDHEKYP